ncbi:MAG TPA: hypothetical protein VHG51_09300 [Longimicrobiaceae bacterium]|nr:hypothetical protein [Longimicrobiaceae bacterium]
MSRTLARTGRWTLAAGIAGALAFGSTQALAAPAAGVTDAVGTCSDRTCRTICQTIGFGTGWCMNGDCFCYID